MKSFAISCLVASACALETFDKPTDSTALPTAIFHGLGDACIYPGMKHFVKEIADQTKADAFCLEVGNGSETSIFTNFET